MRPINVETHPALIPGVCFRCRTGDSAENREYFVDFGVDVEWFGALYICNLCLLDIVESAKLIDIVSIKSVQKQLDSAELATLEANKTMEAFALVRDHLSNIGLNFDELLNAAVRQLEKQDNEEHVELDVDAFVQEPAVDPADVFSINPFDGVLDPEIVRAHAALPVNDDGSVNTEVIADLRENDDAGTDDGDDSESIDTESAPDAFVAGGVDQDSDTDHGVTSGDGSIKFD